MNVNGTRLILKKSDNESAVIVASQSCSLLIYLVVTDTTLSFITTT